MQLKTDQVRVADSVRECKKHQIVRKKQAVDPAMFPGTA